MEEHIYNKIYDDTVIKYTLNVPIEAMAKIIEITGKKTKYAGRKSVWFREAVFEKLAHTKIKEKPATLTQLRTMFSEGKVYESPKRYSGFMAGLLRNPFRLRNFRRKQREWAEYCKNNA